jgi:hypothetical protein
MYVMKSGEVRYRLVSDSIGTYRNGKDKNGYYRHKKKPLNKWLFSIYVFKELLLLEVIPIVLAFDGC